MGRTALRDLVRRLTDAGLSKFVVRPTHVASWDDELDWLADAARSTCRPDGAVRIEPPRPPGHPIDEAARLRLHLALVVAETAVDPIAAWRALDLWPDGGALVERAEREVLAATDRRARRTPATADRRRRVPPRR